MTNEKITQADKLAALHNSNLLRKRAELNTYHARAQVEADDAGGRYAKLQPTTVIGSTGAPAYPQQPEGSPWRGDLIGQEPPLGYSVDAIDPVGEPHEIAEAAAIIEHADASSPSVCGGAASEAPAVVGTSAAPPTSTLLRRRL
jgi:hypothetical protein